MVDVQSTSYFDRFVEIVLGNEGGPTNDPDDPGGSTHFGISRVYHPSIPWPPTRDQAIQIYRHDYWAPLRADDLPPGLALSCFDAAVVPGLGWTAGALQDVLRVERDFVIGPDTVFAAKHSTWQTVLNFTDARIAEFERRTRINPTLTKYIMGWRRRVLRVYREAVKLEGE